MSLEIEHQLYMAVGMGMFTGALLMWAIPFVIPTWLKVRLGLNLVQALKIR